MPLIGQISETDKARQLSANNVPHVTGSCGGGFGIPRRDGLRYGRARSCGHVVTALNVWRYGVAIGGWYLRHRRCASRRRRGGRDTVGSCFHRGRVSTLLHVMHHRVRRRRVAGATCVTEERIRLWHRLRHFNLDAHFQC